jgi:hypothetical protein
MRLIELQLSTSADLQACVVESLRNTDGPARHLFTGASDSRERWTILDGA